MKTITSHVLAFAVALVLAAPLRAQVAIPPLINYQGRVAVGGVNFDGAGSFKFALVNTDGTTTYWSNDGTSTIGDEPAAAVSLTVAKGLYSVLLGDDSQVNMVAVPASVFANSDVRLRVWFDDGVNGSQLLAPDQRLAPTAYLADGAVTSASIAPEAVTSASIAPMAINGTHILPGSLDFSALTVPIAPGAGQVLGFDGNSLAWTAPGGGGGGISGSGTTNSIPLWTGGTFLGNSLITQSANGVQLPNGVQLGPGTNGNSVTFGSPNSETGMTMSGPVGRADIRFDGTTLRMLAGPAGFPPSIGVAVNTNGVQLPNGVQLGLGTNGYQVGFGSPNSEDGMTMSGPLGRADLRYNGTLKLVNGAGGIPLATNGIAITNAGNVGIGTETPQAKLHIVGTVRTSILTISGGVDLAEPFQMEGQELEKGTVVVIDEEHPGQLKRSTNAYDTRVAGIISGANGINPGISLQQDGVVEGGQNVALSGRVYVQADASNGAIKPGDMLTTSDIPGHAMKALDHDRAQGAVIGKAMSALPEGRGFVLVLVTLQ